MNASPLPRRTVAFAADGGEGVVLLVSSEGAVTDQVEARGEVTIPEGCLAVFAGEATVEFFEDGEGITNFMLDSGIDDSWIEFFGSLPHLRQIRATSTGLTSSGVARLATLPGLRSLGLYLAEEPDGGTAVLSWFTAASPLALNVELIVGRAALPAALAAAEQGQLEAIELDVDGASEQELLPLRLLLPSREFNGIVHSAKALARLRSRYGDS